jgi:hypothetical protein
MVDARHPLNAAKAHAIERHLNAQVFDLGTIALRRRVLPKLAMAVSTEVALLAVGCPFFTTLLLVQRGQFMA